MTTLEIIPSLKLAWIRIKGFKITAWMSAAFMIFLPILCMALPLLFGTSTLDISEAKQTINVVLSPSDYPNVELFFMITSYILGVFALMLFAANLLMQGVRNVRHQNASAIDAITSFSHPIRVCVGFVIFILINASISVSISHAIQWLKLHVSVTQLPFVTGLEFGLSLGLLLFSMLFIFFPSLIIDKHRTVFHAFRESLTMSWQFKGTILVLFGFCVLIQYVMMLPIILWQSAWMLLVSFIINIWFLPFILNIYGVAYNRLFHDL